MITRVRCYYIKEDVEEYEYLIHKYIYDNKIVKCPEIYSYNKNLKLMTMEKITNMNVSDFYGEKADKVPKNVFNKIQNIIKKLKNKGIFYIDITGYNFVEKDDDIWILDFKHAKIYDNINEDELNFVNRFINAKNEQFWNGNLK